tara:strand:+ start:582 stop:935 length:354 start_codon:yes stop_codon:yes gene_type:complete
MIKKEKLIFLDKIQRIKLENRFLVDYANLISRFFKFQRKLLSKKIILSFEKNKQFGLPILVPKFINKNLEMFTYKYIKKYSKNLFSKTENSILLRVSFPTGGMRANTFTILYKKSLL